MPKIFLPVLRDQITAAIQSDAKIKSLALNEARTEFYRLESEFYKAFEDHPVTQELKSAKGESLSGAITGPPGANLFSYIGFKKSPIPELKRFLKERIKFNSKSGRVVKQTSGLAYSVEIEIPVNKDLYDLTPYPNDWEPGKSWLQGIETYIAGVAHYLTRGANIRYGQKKNLFKNSRSGEAVQVKQPLKNPATFSKVNYITGLLSNFRSKFRGKGGRFI